MAAVLLTASCGSNRVEQLADENAELRSQVAELQQQLTTARDAIDETKQAAAAVTASSGELRSNVDRLASEDWQSVVPDVDTSAGEVDTAQETLSASVSDLDDAVPE